MAEATLQLAGTDLRDATGEDGRFRIRGVPPGTHRLVVRRLGFEPLELPVEVSSGARRTIELRLVRRPVPVEPVRVTAIGSRAEQAELRERMRRIPGAVAYVSPEAIESTRQANLSDVLRFVPGVWAQPKFGAADKAQLSIRGSGLRSSFELQGVNVLVNGMPYRNADGFTDLESLELLSVEHIEVYKGGNALRYGGSTLGGAIDLRTRTGRTAAPLEAFAQAGSYGFFKGRAGTAGTLGGLDFHAAYARSELDGYRAQAGNTRDRLNAHLGWLLSPRVDLRGFYLFASVSEERPGSLTGEEFEADPRQAAGPRVEDPWGREYTLHHLGLQLRSQLGARHRLEVAPYLQYRDLLVPTFRFVDQVSRDYGVEVRYENEGPLEAGGHRFAAGVQAALGEIDHLEFARPGGERGPVAKEQRDEAATIALYAEDVIGITERLSTVLGVRYDRARRAIADRELDDGDQSDERWLDALLPRIGIVHALPAVDGEWFANATRLWEPPLLLELNSLPLPGFIALEPQRAWQLEVGVRGETRGIAWELSAYDVELRDEIINVNVRPSPEASFTVPSYRNADRTRHYGLEAAVEGPLPFARGVRGAGAAWSGRLAYTWGRYEYVRDSVFDGHRIPGAPEHVLRAQLAYRSPFGLAVRPGIEWVPGSYFVNSANTVRNEGWMALDVRAEWALPSLGAAVFTEARNLTDARYSPAVNADNALGRYFLPADGRSVYAGLRWRR